MGSAGAGGFGDLFSEVFRRGGPVQGADLSAEVEVDFVSAVRGATLELALHGPEPVKVKIPPGAGDGDRVRVRGQGAQGHGGPPGDLLVTLRVGPHPCFRREGLDLHLDLPVTVGEAWAGAKVKVPTPEGEVTLTVPRGAQSGQIVRLKGRGVRRKSDVGDLYVRFLVRLPEARSAELDAAIAVLEAAMPADVRAAIRF